MEKKKYRCGKAYSMRSAGFGLIMLLLVSQGMGCSGKKNNSDSSNYNTSDSERSIKNFTLVETEGDIKKWVLEAVSAKFIEIDGGEGLDIKDFTVNFFEDNKVQAVLKGKSGIYNKTTEIFLLKYNRI